MAFVTLVGFPPAIQGQELGPHTRYTIRVSLDDRAHTLDGSAVVEYVNASAAPLEELYLHLHANAYSGAHTALARDRSRLPFFADASSAFPGDGEVGSMNVTAVAVGGRAAPFSISESLLRMPLAESLPPGGTARLQIEFTVKIPRFRDRFGYRGGNYAITAWFPKMAVHDGDGWHTTPLRGIGEFFSEAADYSVTITTPAGFVVGATGERVGHVSEAGGSETTRWEAHVARDFAWVADASYRIKKATRDGVTVEYLYFERDEKAAERGLELSLDALRYFGDRYGRYPFPTFRVAESSAIAPGLGIEFPQLTLISMDLHRSAEVLTAFETTLIHEVAHQWWYGMVGNDETTEAWLDESFATYATRRYWRDAEGGEPAMLRLPGRLSALDGPTDTEVARYTYVTAARTGLEQEVRTPASGFDDAQSYTAAVYYKGSFVLGMLEGLLGTAVFDDVLRSYVRDYRNRIATTADFIAVAEAVSGRQLLRFFEEWLDTTETCDYSVEGISSVQGSDGFVSTIALRRNAAIVMPVTVRLTLRNGDVLDRDWDGEAEAWNLEIQSREPVTRAVVDPERRLLEADRVNNYAPRLVVRSFNPLTVRDDAYAVTHLPYAWYDDGLELGLLLWAGYPPLPVFPAGIEREHGVALALAHNLGRDQTTFSLAYRSPLKALGSRAFWGVDAEHRRGRERGGVGVRWYGGAHLYRGPYHALEMYLEHDRWSEDAGAAHPHVPFLPGTLRGIRARYAYNNLVTDFYPIAGGLYEISATVADAALGSEWSFTAGLARGEWYRSTPVGVLALDLVHGSTWGSPPLQELPSLRRHANFVAQRFENTVARRLTAAQVELRPVLVVGVLSLALATKGAWHPDAGATGDWSGEVAMGLRLFANMPYAIQLDVSLFTATSSASAWRLGGPVVRFGRPFGLRAR